MILSLEPKIYRRIGIELNPGTPLQLSWICFSWMPPRMLASPSRRRIVCSATRWLRIGSVTPLMVTDPLCAVTSIFILIVTSRSKCTVGVTSIFTPTSWYWNWVFTSELTRAVAAPVWYEPVAIGMRDPIFSVAFCWSAARMRGFCRFLALYSRRSALAVATQTVTERALEFRCAKLYSVGLVAVVLGVQSVLPVGHVVVELLVVGGVIATPALEGQVMPRLRSQFLLTSSTAMSTTTSGRALSRSLTSFCASSSSSGVARITIAFWLATP